MAGMTGVGPAVAVLLTAGLVVVGAFLWISGASTAPHPTAYAGASVFQDDTTPSTILDVSRSVTFTFAFVTDQPWAEDGFAQWSGTLAARAGGSVGTIQIGTLGAFLCDSRCTNNRFVYADLESLNQTAPFQWTSYPGTPHFLTGLGGGGGVYITFNLAMTIFYTDGTYWSGGWWSELYFGPMVTAPNNVATGQAILTWGVLLLVPSCGVAFMREYDRRLVEP